MKDITRLVVGARRRLGTSPKSSHDLTSATSMLRKDRSVTNHSNGLIFINGSWDYATYLFSSL